MRIAKLKLALAAGLCAGVAGCSTGQVVEQAAPDQPLQTTFEQRMDPAHQAARMAWFEEARFGLFIHWGLYAVPAGTWEGNTVRGNAEWLMLSLRIPVADYAGLAEQFNPVHYDAEAWVLAAKQAGMRYIVITAKHHDGFALFDSAASGFNVVDATPYGRDLLEPLADACKKHGLRFGVYYSQAMDWHHRGGVARGGHWDPDAQDGDMDAYIDQVAAPQVRELLENYDPDIIWWDTPDGITMDRAWRIYESIRAKPDIIMNSRLADPRWSAIPVGTEMPDELMGDFGTAERRVPAEGLPEYWENCQTMQRSWAYHASQGFRPVEELLHTLINNASRGGNYLLNVGPRADGTFPPESIERLQAIGRWMEVNGESIYGTDASVFGELPFGRSTTRANDDGKTTIYLHVFDWPANGYLSLPGLESPIKSATLLHAADQGLSVVSNPDGVQMINLQSAEPFEMASVIALQVDGVPNVDRDRMHQAAQAGQAAGEDTADAQFDADVPGQVVLAAQDARLTGGIRLQRRGRSPQNLGYWTNPQATASWQIEVEPGKTYRVLLEYSCAPGSEGSGLALSLGQANGGAVTPIEGLIEHATRSWDDYRQMDLGTWTADEQASVRATLRATDIPGGEGSALMNLRRIRLMPAAAE